jgi:hypothetical protein
MPRGLIPDRGGVGGLLLAFATTEKASSRRDRAQSCALSTVARGHNGKLIFEAPFGLR